MQVKTIIHKKYRSIRLLKINCGLCPSCGFSISTKIGVHLILRSLPLSYGDEKPIFGLRYAFLAMKKLADDSGFGGVEAFIPALSFVELYLDAIIRNKIDHGCVYFDLSHLVGCVSQRPQDAQAVAPCNNGGLKDFYIHSEVYRDIYRSLQAS